MIGHRILARTLASAAASLVGLAFAASSQAAVGDIAFADCIAELGQSGCVDPALDSLAGARDVAVSPDGNSVYVVSAEDDSLTHLSRNAAGQLSFQGCIADIGLSDCADPPFDSLAVAYDVEVSPDGSSVYVASLLDDSLTHFSRNAAGQITFQGCIADGGKSGCFDPGTDSLAGARDVEVSPDGSSVYVASDRDHSLTHFSRDAAGQITFQGCIADGGKSGCFNPGTDPLAGASDVAVSPDGASVYVASLIDDSLTHFSRNAAGQIFFQGCIAEEGKSGCFDPGTDSLAGAQSVALSPDGSSVYVATHFDDSLTHFSRNAAGQIFFQGCIADGGKSGCFDPGTDSLAGAQSVALSPDGSSVYVASPFDSSLTHFSRDAAGQIFFQGCIANGGLSGCADPPLDSLDGAGGVAVSPDGRSVYVASLIDSSLTRFSGEPKTTITEKPKNTTTKRKAEFKFVSDPTTGATFECKLDRKPFRPCSSPFEKRVEPGKHSFSVRATVAGVTDPTSASARWRVTR